MAPFNVLTATAAEIQRMLQAGSLTSVQLVDSYTVQIKKHDDYLHAVLQISPEARTTAEALDKERKFGTVRGPLHGIPILLKDNIATHSRLGLDTTAGSFALVGSVPKDNADIVNQLINAGAIILGKTNLSEFAHMKGSDLQPGWSAVGGQTQSAYVRGGVVPDGSILGHSSPGGSSTGSAVAVSAGYAPIAIGTETDGSIITPSNRAALYAMRPTHGLISSRHILPASEILDTAGPIAKSVEDLANLLDAIVDPKHPSVPKEGYITEVKGSWSGLRVGVLDPEEFFFGPDVMKPHKEATAQMVSEIRKAYAKIKPLVNDFHENISYVTLLDLEYNGSDVLYQLLPNDFKSGIERYLAALELSKVRTLEDIIRFNENNAEKELPPYAPNQSLLISFLQGADRMSEKERQSAVDWMRAAGGPNGIDHYLKKYKIDVIIGPADCECTEPPAAAGYPLATMPLSYLDLNGRPFGMSAVASAGQEHILIRVLSAWEATFPPRIPPPMLERSA